MSDFAKIASLVLLSACAPCEDLCFVNEGSVTPEGIEFALYVVESRLNAWSIDVDIKYLFNEFPHSVEFVDGLIASDSGGTAVGVLYDDRSIKIRRKYSEILELRILAHEILHVVAKEYMLVDPKKNHDHTVPLMFMQYCISRKCSDDNTIEGEIVLYLVRELSNL